MVNTIAQPVPQQQTQPQEQAPAQPTETQEQPEQTQQQNPVSPLDPDFLLFALPMALLLDFLYWVFQIGEVFNLILGFPLSLWIQSKIGKRSSPQRPGQQPQGKMMGKVLRRWGTQFIPGLNLTFRWTRMVFSTLSQK